MRTIQDRIAGAEDRAKAVADRAGAKDPGQAERDQAGTADLEEWSWTGAGPTQAHPKRRMSGTWPGARVAVEVLAACALTAPRPSGR